MLPHVDGEAERVRDEEAHCDAECVDDVVWEVVWDTVTVEHLEAHADVEAVLHGLDEPDGVRDFDDDDEEHAHGEGEVVNEDDAERDCVTEMVPESVGDRDGLCVMLLVPESEPLDESDALTEGLVETLTECVAEPPVADAEATSVMLPLGVGEVLDDKLPQGELLFERAHDLVPDIVVEMLAVVVPVPQCETVTLRELLTLREPHVVADALLQRVAELHADLLELTDAQMLVVGDVVEDLERTFVTDCVTEADVEPEMEPETRELREALVDTESDAVASTVAVRIEDTVGHEDAELLRQGLEDALGEREGSALRLGERVSLAQLVVEKLKLVDAVCDADGEEDALDEADRLPLAVCVTVRVNESVTESDAHVVTLLVRAFVFVDAFETVLLPDAELQRLAVTLMLIDDDTEGLRDGESVLLPERDAELLRETLTEPLELPLVLAH